MLPVKMYQSTRGWKSAGTLKHFCVLNFLNDGLIFNPPAPLESSQSPHMGMTSNSDISRMFLAHSHVLTLLHSYQILCKVSVAEA